MYLYCYSLGLAVYSRISRKNLRWKNFQEQNSTLETAVQPAITIVKYLFLLIQYFKSYLRVSKREDKLILITKM